MNRQDFSAWLDEQENNSYYRIGAQDAYNLLSKEISEKEKDYECATGFAKLGIDQAANWKVMYELAMKMHDIIIDGPPNAQPLSYQRLLKQMEQFKKDNQL